jgi:Immunity protein 53
MPDFDELVWLQNWYLSNCDGEWEHSYGVRIGTLDNPGWSIHIDLKGTHSEGLQHETLNIDHGEIDWIVCRIERGEFEAFGDPTKLKQMIALFKDWVEAFGSQS